MKRDAAISAGFTIMMHPPRLTTTNCIRAWLVFLAWFVSSAECIIVPTGKVGPITPYRSTPRPTPDPSRIRDPAPVVEYSPEHPEPPLLDPSYAPPSYKTLSALSGNSIFYIPLKIRNIHAFQGNNFAYVSSPQQPASQQPPSPSQPKFVTWKATYNTPEDNLNNNNVDVNIQIPVKEVDYLFPKKYQQIQQQPSMNPIVVPPLPPVQQDYYHYNYNKRQQQQNNNDYYNNNNNYNKKNVYEDPQENKSTGQHYKYDNNQQQYPKKYNNANSDGSTTKYYYYVKHDYRTNNNNDINKNNNNQ